MKYKKWIAMGLTAALGLSLLTACGGESAASGGEKQVVIYSNADEEAITAMQNALDNNGYKGKYIFQTYGTSELGGKLLAEGTNLEADLVTMSTFYLQSAQEPVSYTHLDVYKRQQDKGRPAPAQTGVSQTAGFGSNLAAPEAGLSSSAAFSSSLVWRKKRAVVQ